MRAKSCGCAGAVIDHLSHNRKATIAYQENSFHYFKCLTLTCKKYKEISHISR